MFYQYLILVCAGKAFFHQYMLDNNNSSINTLMKKYYIKVFNSLKATFECLLKSHKQFV